LTYNWFLSNSFRYQAFLLFDPFSSADRFKITYGSLGIVGLMYQFREGLRHLAPDLQEFFARFGGFSSMKASLYFINSR
jgi:hypothetical protein